MIDPQVPYRIQRIYSSSTEKERAYLKKILEEIADTGDSPTYRDIWLSDYKEIPVDIDTFLCDDHYLGKTNRNGDAIYPYWRKVFRDIFHNGNKYEEVFFTGATRIGKSSTAVACTAYMLYKLMCLRDPQQYFGKKDISKFSILFFNLTKDLAKGVAFTEFQSTILSSPWFLEHGQVAGSEKNPYYFPEGGKISIDFGSAAAHALGQQVLVGFCLVGSTLVETPSGIKSLEELHKSKETQVYSYNVSEHVVEISRYKEVRLTKYVSSTTIIELEDGTVLEGTSDHRVLLSNGEYKPIVKLTSNDDILSLNSKFTCIRVKTKRDVHYDSPIPVYDIISVENNHNFVIHGNSCSIVPKNCDEINFSQAGVKDVNKAKARMKDLYNTISARVKGTFRMNGEVYGKIFAVSSKRGDSDFMEAYIQQQLEAGAGDHMYVSDAPQWEVLPKSMFSPGHFYIAVGDRHKKGFVVPDNQTFPDALDDLKNQGYKLLTPPIDMRPEFLADFEIALRDLAGISVPGALSFITQEAITECINKERKNPFYSDILQIGMKDSYTIEEFFHINDIPETYRRMPMFIHLDLSINTDRTGIGCVCINGRKDIVDQETGKMASFPTFGHVFSIALEAPRGDRIPYSKIVTFIKWLRDKGLNIAGISRDTFQSEYVGQLLTELGFDVKTLSLDRTPDGYIALRSVLLEKRIDMLDVQLLQDELIHLQRDSNTGRVDHPVGGGKDCADGFAGAVWNAILTNPPTHVPVKNIAKAMQNTNLNLNRGRNTQLPSMFGQYNRFGGHK